MFPYQNNHVYRRFFIFQELADTTSNFFVGIALGKMGYITEKNH